jgi:hypothetical protein
VPAGEFQSLDQLLEAGNPAAVFDHLIAHYTAQQDYSKLFETRMMKSRFELGLPMFEPITDEAGAELRATYDRSIADAAREAGSLFLARGEIARAWPYYRALGEREPVAAAIETFCEGEQVEPVIEIALGERVHPRKGLQLVLEHHGICRAITCFDQYPDPGTRDESLRMLFRHLYEELTGSLRRVIEAREGRAPETSSVTGLIAGRDWLFGEYDYYVDTSHLISLLRFALDSADPEILSRAVEFAEYGDRLAPMFHHRNDPPLDDLYRDHSIWLRALLGQGVDEAVTHFRSKLASIDPDQYGSYPAQVVVRLLWRLERYRDAIEVFQTYLHDTDRRYLNCPGIEQLYRLAGEHRELCGLARSQSDLLGYAAARLWADGKCRV